MYNRHVTQRSICVLLVLLSGIGGAIGREAQARAQRERDSAKPQEQSAASSESDRYDRKFFIQLRGVFGRFRDSDLERVFDQAKPIQCSELVNDEGEWRTV